MTPDRDSAADGPTTKYTKVTTVAKEDNEPENGSRDIDSAPERSRRGIP